MKKVQGFTWTVADTALITGDDTYGEVLVELARRDPTIVALTADLGSTTKIGRFREVFPDRFFNVGVAEQNLIAVAAGLAAAGLTPVASTYAVFASLRAAEFIRADLCYNQRNVKIIGTLAGVSFGQGGPTHHSIEDVALLRAVPGLVILAPCDGHQAAAALRAALAHQGPVYLRLARGMEPPVYSGPDIPFVIGKATCLRQGPHDRAAVLASGPAVHHALCAAERAEALGCPTRVVDMASLKPLDDEAVADAAATGHLITAEDHSVIGGLGSAVADVIALRGLRCSLRKLGHQDRFSPQGIPEDLAHLCGFDEDAILEAILEASAQPSASQPASPQPASAQPASAQPAAAPQPAAARPSATRPHAPGLPATAGPVEPAPDRPALRARVFLRAVLPLLEETVAADPELRASLRGHREAVQFQTSDGSLGAFVQLEHDRVSVHQRLHPDPAVRLRFRTARALGEFFAGKASLPSIDGLRHPRLIALTLRLLSTLRLLEPGSAAPPVLRARLLLSLITRGLAELHRGGFAPMLDLARDSPERVYQWTIRDGQHQAHLWMHEGQVEGAPGPCARRRPFVHFLFPDVASALAVFDATTNQVDAVRKGLIETVGSPEYSRKIGLLMQQLDELLTEG